MRQLVLVGLFSLLLIGCTTGLKQADQPRVYASPAEAFAHEYAKDAHAAHPIEFVDIQASIALLGKHDLGKMFDLNGDGIDECLVTAKYLFAINGKVFTPKDDQGNYNHYLLHRAGGGWTVSSRFVAAYYDCRLRETKTDGWIDINTQTRGIYDSVFRYYVWDGTAYRESRNTESHYASPAEAFVYSLIEDRFRDRAHLIDIPASVAMLENQNLGHLHNLDDNYYSECIYSAKHLVLKNGSLRTTMYVFGDYPHYVLHHKGTGWGVKSMFYALYNDFDVTLMKSNGWRDILAWKGAGFSPVRVTYRWDGSGYRVE